MLASLPMSAVLDHDSHLVARSVAGNRSAFAQIVERYQALVCSVAYSATGSLSQSEDLAQETFLTAWRQLRDLREPERLRAWLCGIARNLSHNLLRRDAREPSEHALPIENASDAPALESPPPDEAIRAEEQTILWRSLGRIPEAYREPLVLFYREQQSVERVAQSLELTEDTVRQRLSRGRKLLHEEVLAFVEGALERSAPGKAFTLAVIAALPVAGVSHSAAAAVVGATAAQGSAVAKSAGLVAGIATLFGPLVSAFSAYFSVRAALDAAAGERERAHVRREAARLIGVSILYAIALWAFILTRGWWGAEPAVAIWLVNAVSLGFGAWLAAAIVRGIGAGRALHADELARAGVPACADPRFHEYRSAATLLGLPLVHMRLGVPPPGAGPARGWIAIGDVACGVLFAMGNITVGGISLGVVSAGVLTVGGVSIGVVPIASIAFGWLALGGAAYAQFAVGGLAMGLEGAAGGMAIANTFAAGGFAQALHANDEIARAMVQAWLPGLTFPLMLLAMAALAIIPTAWYARRMRRLTKNL
jgi:RNA polymerase sigma factor (sigma-70 family)